MDAAITIELLDGRHDRIFVEVEGSDVQARCMMQVVVDGGCSHCISKGFAIVAGHQDRGGASVGPDQLLIS